MFKLFENREKNVDFYSNFSSFYIEDLIYSSLKLFFSALSLTNLKKPNLNQSYLLLFLKRIFLFKKYKEDFFIYSLQYLYARISFTIAAMNYVNIDYNSLSKAFNDNHIKKPFFMMYYKHLIHKDILKKYDLTFKELETIALNSFIISLQNCLNLKNNPFFVYESQECINILNETYDLNLTEVNDFLNNNMNYLPFIISEKCKFYIRMDLDKKTLEKVHFGIFPQNSYYASSSSQYCNFIFVKDSSKQNND